VNRTVTTIGIVMLANVALAQVIVYEAEQLPETQGWGRDGTFDADRSIRNGILTIDVDLGIWEPLPFGEIDAYRWNDMGQFVGGALFVEWRCRADSPSTELEGTASSVLNVAGGPVINHLTIAEDRFRVWRGNSVPLLFVDIAPNVFHRYRIETRVDQTYRYFIDGDVVDEGELLAPFPNSQGIIIWGSRMYLTPSRNEWDYIRFGKMPADGSGDFDSNGSVELFDFRYFAECRSNSGPGVDAGPGCRWADTDADTDVDAQDFAQFQQRIAEVSGG
jgi:hypothetical protein